MKTNIRQQIEYLIRDNRHAIVDFGGNVADYLEEDFCAWENGHHMYLTPEEVEEWENDEQRREELINEIHDLLGEYNYDITFEDFDENDFRQVECESVENFAETADIGVFAEIEGVRYYKVNLGGSFRQVATCVIEEGKVEIISEA